MSRSPTDRLRRLGVATITGGVLLLPFIAWMPWSNFLSDTAAATTAINDRVSALFAGPARTVPLTRATQADLAEAFAFARIAIFPTSELVYVQRANAKGDAAELLDRAGRVVGAADFSDPNFSGDTADGLFPARRGQQHGYINDRGQWVIPPRYRGAYPFKNGVAMVRAEDRFQLIDTRGNPLITESFKRIFLATRDWVVADDRWYRLDQHGKWTATPNPYTEVTPFTDRLVVARRENRSVLVDRSGKQLTPEHFDYIQRAIHGRALVRKDNKWGVIDTQGRWLLAPQYESLGMTEEGLLLSQQQGQLQFLDNSGKPLPAMAYRPLGKGAEGLTGACQELRCGYVDDTGQWAIAPQFENIQPFAGGIAQVTQYGLVAYIDRNGRMITPAPPATAAAPRLWRPDAMRDAHSNNGGTVFGYLDRTGKIAIPAVFSRATGFAERLAAVQASNGEFGYIGPDGRWVIPPSFRDALPFSEGWAMVKGARLHFGNPVYIDTQGKVQLQLPAGIEKAGNFKNGVASMQEWGGRTTQIDKTGKPVSMAAAPPAAVPALQRLSINGGKWGYADAQDRYVIAPRFDVAEDFSEDLAAVRIGTHWGYINRSGKVVIPPAFDQAGKFTEGLAPVRTGQLWTYIDIQGQPITPDRFTVANDFHDGLALVGFDLDTAKRRAANLADPGMKVPDFMPNWPPMLSAGGDMRAGLTWIQLVSGGYYNNYRLALMNKRGELILPTAAPTTTAKPRG